MAFNKISLNSVEANNVNQVTILPSFPVVDVVNQFDIFYHLGSSLNQGAWSNPQGVDVSITLSGSVSSGSASDILDRNQSNQIIWSSPAGAQVDIELLNNFEIDLHSYIVAVPGGGGTISDWILEGSTDNVTWILLDTVSGATSISNDEDIYYCESRLGFFKYFRFRNLTFAGADRLGDILFFGRLRNLITGQAAVESTKDIFASYPSIDAIARDDNTILRYDGNYWEPRIRFPYEVIKLNLSGDHTITSAYKPTFYVVSPGGAARVITLPTSPDTDDVIKIKNVDGAFDVTVEEFVGDPTPVVLNNAGKLQYEFVYDGVEWQVTG